MNSLVVEPEIVDLLRQCVTELFPHSVQLDHDLELRALADRELGDLTSTCAITLSRKVSITSEQIAIQIAEYLEPKLALAGIAQVSAQRSYVNFSLQRKAHLLDSGVAIRSPRIMIFGRPKWLPAVGYMRMVSLGVLQAVVTVATLGAWPKIRGAANRSTPESSPWEIVRGLLLTALDSQPSTPAESSKHLDLSQTSDIEQIYFCAPESLPTPEFKRLSAELKAQPDGLLRLHVPSRDWLAMQDTDLWRQLILEASESELSSLLLYLASPTPGVELDYSVPRLNERGNLGIWLTESLMRLERIVGSFLQVRPTADLQSEFADDNWRFLAIRADLLKALCVQAVQDGSVAGLALGIQQLLVQLCATLNTPQLRARITKEQLTTGEGEILYGVWRALSASIGWVRPSNPFARN